MEDDLALDAITERLELRDLVRRERLVRNEEYFRSLNEQIKAAGRPRPEPETVLTIICECADRRCGEIVRVTLGEYQGVRARPDRFFVRPGHVFPEVERVVDVLGAAEVVEKL